MRRLRTLSVMAAIPILATACGTSGAIDSAPGANHTRAKTMRLQPGHYTFRLGGRVRVGDKIMCVTKRGLPRGGGFVEKPGYGVGSSTGFKLVVSTSGTVKITCPRHPGNV
jgi:hypothetical protein